MMSLELKQVWLSSKTDFPNQNTKCNLKLKPQWNRQDTTEMWISDGFVFTGRWKVVLADFGLLTWGESCLSPDWDPPPPPPPPSIQWWTVRPLSMLHTPNLPNSHLLQTYSSLSPKKREKTSRLPVERLVLCGPQYCPVFITPLWRVTPVLPPPSHLRRSQVPTGMRWGL